MFEFFVFSLNYFNTRYIIVESIEFSADITNLAGCDY